MASSQTSRKDSSKKSGNCLGILLKLALLVGCVYGYSLLGANYVNHSVFVVDSSAQTLNITATRGQSLTFEVRFDDDGSSYLASPAGIQLSLDGVSQRFQVLAPQPVDWKDGGTITVTTNRPHDVAPPSVAGTITLPASLGGPEDRVLQGKIQGTILQPFSKTTVDKPVQIHLISQGAFLLSGGQLFFDAAAGFGILLGLFMLWLQGWHIIIAHKALPKEKKLTPSRYLLFFCVGAVIMGAIAFGVQLVVTHFFIGVPDIMGASYPGEINWLTFGIPALIGMSFWIYTIRLYITGKLAS